MILAKMVFVLIAALVVSGSQTPLTTQPTVAPTLDNDSTIIRYDWNRTGVASETSNIVIPHVRWTFTVNGTLATGALASDVNGDGRKEVFFGELRTDKNQRLQYALDADGNVLWTFAGKWDLGPAALADLDHDGVLELVIGEGAHQPLGGLNLTVINAVTGALKWRYTDVATYWEEGFASAPIVYDVDGDGIDDLTLGSLDRYVYTFSGKDGSIIWRSPIFEHYIRSSPAFTDLDGDGEKDFVIWDNHAVTRAYSIKTHRMLWEQRLGYGVASTPAIGDLDGDGRPEIVFSLVTSGGVRVLNDDGSILWVNTNWKNFYHSPTLVDVDGDGLLDVVQGDSGAYTITAYRGTDGVELWNTKLPNTTWSQAPLVTADIDGDGTYEILVGADSGLFSLEMATGAVNWLFPSFKVRGEPRVTDLDGDGMAEILFGAGDRKMYVIDQAPPPKFEPRTIGYWKHQCRLEDPKGEHVGITQAFIDAIRGQSRVFADLDTPDQACTILWGDYQRDMAGRARQQLLALWLNVMAGFVDMNVPIHLPKLTTATTVGEAILDAEDIILTHTDKPSLERAKDICDSLNNGMR